MKKKFLSCLVLALFFKTVFSVSTQQPIQFIQTKEDSIQRLAKRSSLAEWTVLVFMQADNSLYPFVLQDLVEMAKVGTNSQLNIITVIDCPKLLGTGNFFVQIDYGVAYIVGYIPTDFMGEDVVQSLIYASNWMVSNYPAKHYLVDLWNHGRGILDPEPVRSILFDDTCGTFMNNQQLKTALDYMKANILGGKNLDILGMDVCLMSMIEVGYQVKDDVDYLVSSQAPASALGWDYEGFLSPMSEHNLTPLQVVNNIMSSYKAFYQKDNTSNAYAQSGIASNKIDVLKQNIDTLVQNLNVLKEIDYPKANYMIRKARLSSFEFEFDYIDLGTFYNELYKQLSITRQEDVLLDLDAPLKEVLSPIVKTNDQTLRTLLPSYEQQVETTKQTITIGLKLLKEAVVANVVGPDLTLAQGLSIYFPRAETQSSYPKTLFAQECLWPELFPVQVGV